MDFMQVAVSLTRPYISIPPSGPKVPVVPTKYRYRTPDKPIRSIHAPNTTKVVLESANNDFRLRQVV